MIDDISMLRGLPELVVIYVESEARRKSLAASLGKSGIVKIASWRKGVPKPLKRNKPRPSLPIPPALPTRR